MAQQAPTVQIDNLLAQVKTLGTSLNARDRAKVQKSLLDALSHVETPYEQMLRLSGSLACIRFGADIGLFKVLVESQEPLTCSYLGEKLDASPKLLGRILRLLASVGLVKQTGLDTFTAEKITQELAAQALASGAHLLFDIHNRTYQALPDYLSEHKDKEVENMHDGIFQKAFGTDLSCYEYLAHSPKLQGYMQDAMKLNQAEGDWLSVLPLDDEVKQWQVSDPDRVLFVDIGGGMGHQCIRLRDKYPDVPGRVILQDMPITVERIPKPMPHGIEAMAYNFDEPQPIKNAKFYYTRNVLHGLPDSGCIAALKNVAAAMDSESVLVIDDLIVPDEGACTQACQMDFIMMASIAGKKRTKDQWYKLLDAAGFKISQILTYAWPLQDSLIIATPVSD
ncbi:O-methyl transferase B [Fusarium austroafricanum]|uniref:O-methyl transferase B n=1 Tax=Fusarium austroafricanum TaxID=2364996 RepID=A0A8H4KBU8_9HYPO|nr:O-methyl transferase B [Fusarium austroafricanum]